MTDNSASPELIMGAGYLSPSVPPVSFSPVRSDIIQKLHAYIHEGLFGSRPWLGGRDILCGLRETLKPLGLEEPVPGMPNATRETALGRELNVDLMQVFMGLWEPSEIPYILNKNGLISEDEEFEAEKRVIEAEEQGKEEEVQTVLLPLVRRAFFQYFRGNLRVS